MRDLAQIQQTEYDVIIIGGGINGAGVARDAALRGLKTILVEQHDFASGSSSWSSRLIHGGLRYLEYFEFPLVRESLKEREILLRIAPHLVAPLQLTIPIYRDRSRPYSQIWAGMILYDVLSYDKTLPSHRMFPQNQFKQLFRTLEPENLVGGSQYYDAQVALAERLCLENIISAQNAGAIALNYLEVTELPIQDDRITGVVCQDKLLSLIHI
jgi:glycerol-3-phosphate dehydrogenase